MPRILSLKIASLWTTATWLLNTAVLMPIVNNHIVSIKNPLEGTIRAKSIGQIIFDENTRNPGACEIVVAQEVNQSV